MAARVTASASASALVAMLVGWAAVAGDGAGFREVAGDWTGLVSEMGMPRYRLMLSLLPDGTGLAEYPEFPCSAVLIPLDEDRLVLSETVVEGRELCADGTVELVPGESGGLQWLWRDLSGEVRAAAELEPAG